MNHPQRLSDESKLQAWLNRALRANQSDRIVDSATIKVEQRTSGGTKLRVALEAGAAGTYREFKLCRNGQQITVHIDSQEDPATVADDEV